MNANDIRKIIQNHRGRVLNVQYALCTIRAVGIRTDTGLVALYQRHTGNNNVKSAQKSNGIKDRKCLEPI